MSEPLDKVVAEQRLGEMKGIGDALQKKITELVTTGRLAYYEELKAATPPGLVAMLDIPGWARRRSRRSTMSSGSSRSSNWSRHARRIVSPG